MRKALAAFLLASTAVLLYGCAGRIGENEGFQPESSSIYVSSDGSVSSAIVETYEKENYDDASLKTFLDGAVAEYTEEHPGQGEKPAVSLKECSVKNGKMTAVFEYASPEDMIAFGKKQQDDSIALTSMEVKAVSEALSGESGTGNLVDSQNQAADLTEVMKEDRAVAVIAEGEGLIQTEGKILYVSEGTELDSSKNQAKVSGEKSYIIFK